MTPSKAGTGAVLEAMILPALARGGYTAEKQQVIGEVVAVGFTRSMPGDPRRRARPRLPKIATDRRHGRAESPFEVMCLADAVTAVHGARAFLVLGGDGWGLRDYFTSGKLSEHLIRADLVKIVTLEAFIRIANNGKL